MRIMSSSRDWVIEDYWSTQDQARALNEGWRLWEAREPPKQEYHLRVQAYEPRTGGAPPRPRFTQDQHALVHVENMADLGSELHERALACLMVYKLTEGR